MQETTTLDSLFKHAAIQPGEHGRTVRAKVYSALEQRGLMPAPTLVADLVTVAVDGSGPIADGCGRVAAVRVVQCMTEVGAAMSACFGSPLGQSSQRMEAALQFLATWMASAPRPSSGAGARNAIELAALGLAPETPFATDPWFAWRCAEESAFAEGGSPAFRRALAELRATKLQGFGAVDERVWYIRSRADGPARVLDVTSNRRAGVEGESVRSPIGVFREVAPHGLPSDPSRISPSDLALLAKNGGAARALLAAKLADSALMLRFGSMPRPARQRPRALIVLALADTIEMHVQHPGSVVPDIEPLREALLHTVPACLRTFAAAEVDFELEIRREGPIAQGRLHIAELRNRQGKLRLEYRHPDQLLEQLAAKAHWMFADTPLSSRQPPRPMTAGFDACYLVAVGQTARLSGECAWTGSAVIEYLGHANCALRTSGAAGRSDATVNLSEPRNVAKLLAECFGNVPAELEGGTDGQGEPEGVVFS